MRKKILIVSVLLTQLIFSQVTETYEAYAHLANEYFAKKDHTNAAAFYSMAFYTMRDRGTPEDRYRAAIAFACLNQTDTAFKNLIRLAENTDFLNCERTEAQPEFEKLKTDPRWKVIRDRTCGTDYALHRVLMQINDADQTPRLQIDSISEKYGTDSPQWDSVWNLIGKNSRINIERIDSIYRYHGWPGEKLVGREGNITFWLVIQHGPLYVQEKYFPAMQKAVLRNHARARDCAYLEDRILERKKLPQKYGTQYSYRS